MDCRVLDSRKQIILQNIIEDYIQTAEPVGSKRISEICEMSLSPATIRNEMAELERFGFLRQQHTSSGRVPTESAYQYYLKNIVRPSCSKSDLEVLQNSINHAETTESAIKTLAKHLVDLTNEAVILAFDQNRSYHTGVSNLFHKPEFQDENFFENVSGLIDRFDEMFDEFDVKDNSAVYIGSENPFGDQISMITVRYQLQDSNDGFLGLIGPIRMNYSRNISLVKHVKELIDML